MSEQSTKATVVRLMFDRERKLKAEHRFLREARRQSNKSIQELLNDPFDGYPWLLQALLELDNKANEPTLTLNRASELIDIYLKKGGKMPELGQALLNCVSAYMGIEHRPAEGEDPNDSSPGANEQAAG